MCGLMSFICYMLIYNNIYLLQPSVLNICQWKITKKYKGAQTHTDAFEIVHMYDVYVYGVVWCWMVWWNIYVSIATIMHLIKIIITNRLNYLILFYIFVCVCVPSCVRLLVFEWVRDIGSAFVSTDLTVNDTAIYFKEIANSWIIQCGSSCHRRRRRLQDQVVAVTVIVVDVIGVLLVLPLLSSLWMRMNEDRKILCIFTGKPLIYGH